MKTTNRTFLLAVLLALPLAACSPGSDSDSEKKGESDADMSTTTDTPIEAFTAMAETFISKAGFGTTADGQEVMLYTLRNKNGMVAKITNYGGIVVSLTAPDREGNFEDIVLGYETLAEYEQENPYFGALIGRYGNRIGKGQIELDGQAYQLTTNDGPNHLHGGERGFDKVVWDAKMEEGETGPSLLLGYVSEDGEEGYPGSLHAVVRYTLTHENELAIEYKAETDKATPVNLTHHSYFNLSGNAQRDILDHELEILAEHFTPVDDTLIPTGEYRPVEGTPFDFRAAKTIGQDIEADNEQIRFGLGYDHNWVIDQNADGVWRHVATLADPESGRSMTIHTNEPGLQFYSGNFLDGSLSGKGVVYKHRYGLCLETQHFPDSPNRPGFPDTILRPGEVYETRTVYTFGTEG
jgi:aldose 1-epimerase